MASVQPNPVAQEPTTFSTLYHADIFKRTVVPDAATASLLAAIPSTLLQLFLTNENAAATQLSSDIFGTPRASWYNQLPAEVQTYFITSLQNAAATAVATGTAAKATTGALGLPTTDSVSSYSYSTPSYSSYSLPSYTYTVPKSVNTGSSYYTTTSKKHLSTLAIVWIVIGALIVLGIIGTAILFICICGKRARRKKVEAEQQRQILENNARMNAQTGVGPSPYVEEIKMAPKVDVSTYSQSPYNGIPELATTYAHPTQYELPPDTVQRAPGTLSSPQTSFVSPVSPMMGHIQPAMGGSYELPAPEQQGPVEIGGQGVSYSELPAQQRGVSELPAQQRVVSEMSAGYSPVPGHVNPA